MIKDEISMRDFQKNWKNVDGKIKKTENKKTNSKKNDIDIKTAIKKINKKEKKNITISDFQRSFNINNGQIYKNKNNNKNKNDYKLTENKNDKDCELTENKNDYRLNKNDKDCELTKNKNDSNNSIKEKNTNIDYSKNDVKELIESDTLTDILTNLDNLDFSPEVSKIPNNSLSRLFYLFYWNPNSINSPNVMKQNAKLREIEKPHHDIICLCEPYKEYKNALYDSYVPDLSKIEQKKYFVQICIRKNFCDHSLLHSSRDLLIVSLRFENSKKLVFLFCIYMSYNPNDGKERRDLTRKTIIDFFQIFKSNYPNSGIIMIGDFNFDFNKYLKSCLKCKEKISMMKLFRSLDSHNMHYQGVTRVRQTYAQEDNVYTERSRIDWLLSRNIDLSDDYIKAFNKGGRNSDHLAFGIEIFKE